MFKKKQTNEKAPRIILSLALMIMLVVGMIVTPDARLFAQEEEIILDPQGKIVSDAVADAPEETTPPADEAAESEILDEQPLTQEPIQRTPAVAQAADDIDLQYTDAIEIVSTSPATTAGSIAASTFNTNGETANYSVTINYRITDPGGGAGTRITLTLENKLRNHFLAPPASNIVIPSYASLFRSAASEDGGTVSVVIDFSGGTQYSTGAITVVFPFDTKQSGWAATGDEVALITMTAERDGYDDVVRQIRMTSSVSMSKSISISKTPVADTAPDYINNVKLTALNQIFGTSAWRLEPGTEAFLVVEFPAGAVVTDVNRSGVVDEDAGPGIGTITWMMGTADADGFIKEYNNMGSGTLFTFNITFPSSAGFALGDQITLKNVLHYTLTGVTPVEKADTNEISFNLENLYIHIKPNNFKINGGNGPTNALVNIVNSTMSDSAISIGSATNMGTAPVPDTCVTWYNDMDASGSATGNKAKVMRIAVTNGGVPFSCRIVLYCQTAQGEDLEPIYALLNPAAKAGDASYYLIPSLPEKAYVDHFEVWPQDNGADALPVGASMSVSMSFASWPDQCFPDGRAMQPADVTNAQITLTWKGESEVETHTAANYTYDDTTLLSTVKVDKPAYVVYTKYPQVTAIGNRVGADKVQGGDIVSVRFGGYSSRLVSKGVTWDAPMLIYIVPDFLEYIPPTKPVRVSRTDGVDFGEVTIVTDVRNGRQRILIYFPADMKIQSTDGNTYYRTDAIQFKVKENILPGTYWFWYASNVQDFSKYGLLIASSANGAIPIVPYGDTIIDDSGSNWNDALVAPFFSVRGSQGFTVDAKQQLDVDAELYNVSSDSYQSVSTPGALGTLPLSGTGEFRVTMANNGNTYVGGLTLFDILPGIGDKTAMNTGNTNGGATVTRGSQWNATLGSLNFTILGPDGEPVSDAEMAANFSNFKLTLCSFADPKLTNYNGLYRTGANAAFTGNTTDLAAARSFSLTSGNDRLPPGYSIVIVGTIKAPDTMTDLDIDRYAYNSFAINGNYYNAANGTAGSKVMGASEPTWQKFVIAAEGPFTVSFDGNGADSRNPGSITVRWPNKTVNEQSAMPEDPEREGYTFGGWFTENGANGKWGTQFTGANAVEEDITVYAKWTPLSYTVTYNGNGGATINTPETQRYTVPDTEVVYLPGVPTRAGYSFDGWSFHADGSGAEFKAGYTVTGDVTVYARWVRTPYQVSFNTNGGNSAPPATQIHFSGELVSAVADPAREGYLFKGWTMSQSGGTTWDFNKNTMPEKNIVLYAQWEKNPGPNPDPEYYVLSFDLNGATGTAPNNQRLRAGVRAAAVVNPSREGYTFDGWNMEKDGGGAFWEVSSFRMPAYNVTVYAQWARTETPVDPTDPIPPAEQDPPVRNPDADPIPEGVSAISIGGLTIPLTGNAWALVNLILTIAGVVLALVLLVGSLMNRKEDDNSEDKKSSGRFGWRLGTVATALALVIAFVLTEDMTRRMSLLDGWTIVMVILAVIEVIVAILSARKNEKKEQTNRAGSSPGNRFIQHSDF